jgi:hypothetical protein
LVGAFLILQFASLGILQRLETDIADDLRWELTTATAGIAAKFQPFGSGIGTFDPIYRMFEEAERLRAVYANHAHNDYVELLLEGGVPAAILILAFFGWLAYSSLRVWRRPRSGHDSVIDISLPRAATIGAVLICLHSAVDYPLRTTTLSTLFAFACALAIPPLRGRSGNGSGGARESGRSSSHGRRRSTSRPVAAGAEPRANSRGAPD